MGIVFEKGSTYSNGCVVVGSNLVSLGVKQLGEMGF